MTVAELIAILSQFDPEMLALVDGYEGGYDDPKSISIETVYRRDPDYDGYCGSYDHWFDESDGIALQAVLIPR